LKKKAMGQMVAECSDVEWGARGPDRAGSPAAGTKDTLAREVLMAEAAKSGVEPMVFLHRRLKQLIDAGDPKNLKEAVQISVELLPYQHPRLSTTSVNADVKTQNVIRVPEKSSSIDAWLETYGPIVAGLPTKVEN
jgi:hypothetical protein